jgi:hypothetical protein
MLGFAVSCPSPESYATNLLLGQNHFVEPNWHVLTFSDMQILLYIIVLVELLF